MEQDLLEISDGRLYGENDMARVGCHDCAGCASCCQGMGDTILLDPCDIYRMTRHLQRDFSQLLQGPVELHNEQGLILPNLKMVPLPEGLAVPRTAPEGCSFLGADGRCSIHAFRPGICRLFPLGRNYEEDRLTYFVLSGECPVKNKSKVKIRKWLDTPDPAEYQRFLVTWHRLTRQMRQEIASSGGEEEARRLAMLFLQVFYVRPYGEDFYGEFRRRAEALGGTQG